MYLFVCEREEICGEREKERTYTITFVVGRGQLVGLVFCFLNVSPGDHQAHPVRLGDKCLYSLGHFPDPYFEFLSMYVIGSFKRD